MRTISNMLRNGNDLIHPFDRQGSVYGVPCV